MAHVNNTDNFLNTDPRGSSKGTSQYRKPKSGDLGYAQKGAFKQQKPKKEYTPPTYRQHRGAKGTKQWSYGELTSEEREDYKVKHGIAPTAADPSKYGVATRAKAKAAKAKGELTDKDKKAQGVIKTREMDKARYAADIKLAGFRRMKAGAIAHRQANKAKYSAMPKAWDKMSGGRNTPQKSTAGLNSSRQSRRGTSSRTSGIGGATKMRASSNFRFSGNTGTVGFGNLSSSYSGRI